MNMEDSDFNESGPDSEPIGLVISMDELRQVEVKNKNILSPIHLASSQKCQVVIKVLI